MSEATKLLEEVSSYIWTEKYRNLGPGQVVMRLSDEKREILKKLTSDEIANIRPDYLWGTLKRKGRWGR